MIFKKSIPDDKKDDKTSESLSKPILPLRDIVVFPHMIVPLFVGREKSVKALESVMEGDKQIILITQKSASEDDPDIDGLYDVGVIGQILQLLKLPDGTVKVLVEGTNKVAIDRFENDGDFLTGYYHPLNDETDLQDEEVKALSRAIVSQFEQFVGMNKKIPDEMIVSVNQLDDPSKIADTIAAHLPMKLDRKQELLQVIDCISRLEMVYGIMEGEIGVLNVEKRIKNRVKGQMEKTQREYYLNEQMKAIQKELNNDEDIDDIKEFENKLQELKAPNEVKDKAQAELKKLKQMSPMSAESSVVRNYLDWIFSLPWSQKTRIKKDILAAQKILNEDHYGLDKVKDRILEYLAVQQRVGTVKGSTLCFVGPPGVGKTSLAKSIARATNRNYIRLALGGVRDESEIRGHRRTYIGAMPGKIIQSMKKAKTINPLFLLDEIDKLGADWRGDPSSALLEVLDPEQNNSFNDHYMELDYNLSDVMFVCTSNSFNMPQPLLDRMEIIRLSGYTEDEKVEIAKRHLLPKQIKNAGLKKGEFSVDDGAIRDLVRYYTREAGVRSLEREIANLCRKSVKEILTHGKAKDAPAHSILINSDNLKTYAGIRKFRFGEIDIENRVGVVNGLAYTDFGGDLLSIESVLVPGKEGRLSMTGNLKDVMKESITVAEMLIKSRADQMGIDFSTLKEKSIHVHVPEGAVPKDGPSAGAAMVTSIVSTLTNIPIHRDLAMTGEVNLRGHVTAIGGVKEKLLAALRAGITMVLIPEENEKDLEEIPENVKQGLQIIPVHTIEDVLHYALVNSPFSVSDKKPLISSILPQKSAPKPENPMIHH